MSVHPSKAKRGRQYRVETDSSSFIGRFVAFNTGCCVQFHVPGNPYYSIPLAHFVRMERVA